MKSNQQLQKDVMGELRWEPILNASEIGVTALNGVVTLSGTVDSYTKKLAAEKAAKRVSGVGAVAMDIEVKYTGSTRRNDADIAQAALHALKWHSSVPEEKVKIKVEDGWVYLEGEAEWSFQKESAKEAVENLLGVRGVSNFIAIKPRIIGVDVKSKIKSAIQRNAALDADRIQVETSGSKVILKGTVRSWAESADAENAAWAAPGVTLVENDIRVEAPVEAL